MNREEHEAQATVVEWAAWNTGKWPELAWLYAVPNGGGRGKPFITKSGKKLPPLSAVMLKREGLKAGVPDLCFPVARKGFHALYIEMKSSTGKVSDEQRIWQAGLLAQGNLVKTCYSADEAIKALESYLS